MSGAIEIKRGIPMPRAQSSRTLDLPFENMDVGDSFEVEVEKYGEAGVPPEQYEGSLVGYQNESLQYAVQLESRIRSAAYRNGKRLSKRFAVRRLDDNTLGVWRTR